MSNSRHTTDVIVVGAGPVGLFAVFECGMVRLRCHVVDALDAVGGQCTALYPEKPIYDIPGYPRIDAADLVHNLQAQAAPFHPVYHLGQRVERLERTADGWRATTSRGVEIEAKRIRQFGFTEPEMDRAKRQYAAVFERVHAERDKSESAQFAAEAIRHLLVDEPMPGIAYDYRLVQQVLPGGRRVPVPFVPVAAQLPHGDGQEVVGGHGQPEHPAGPRQDARLVRHGRGIEGLHVHHL